MYAPERRGDPLIYITHGTDDAVLPVTNSRDGIVPALRQDGLTVEFVEFNGGHTLPFDIAHAALTWFVNAGAVI
jgi:phospholipase/carboxylesterase